MDLDALLLHYFDTADPARLTVEQFARGKERLAIDFGVEQEPGRKFALWTLMEALGFAPLPEEAFDKHPELKRAAEDYLSAAWKMERE